MRPRDHGACDPTPPPAGGGTGAFHLDEDACLDLVHGLLAPAAASRALDHAAACPRCERMLREQVCERERLLAAAGPQRAADGALDLIRPSPSPAPASGLAPARPVDAATGGAGRRRTAHTRSRAPAGLTGRLPRPALGLATALAAAAALVIVLMPPHGGLPPPGGRFPQPSAAQLQRLRLTWLPGMTSQLRRGAIDSTRPGDGAELAAGLAAYAAHDLERAIELLRRTHAPSDTDELVRRVYLGSSLVLAGRYAQAVPVLESVDTRIVPEPWSAETRWALFIALRESGRGASADSLLHLLAGERGGLGARARELGR